MAPWLMNAGRLRMSRIASPRRRWTRSRRPSSTPMATVSCWPVLCVLPPPETLEELKAALKPVLLDVPPPETVDEAVAAVAGIVGR